MSPEQFPPPQLPEPNPKSEQDASLYFEVARYPTEPLSGLAYFAIQEVIFRAKGSVDLSSYRFQLENLWNVAVLGTMPSEPVKTQIKTIFEKGEPATIPQGIVEQLKQRREQATKLGSWVERHQRPLP